MIDTHAHLVPPHFSIHDIEKHLKEAEICGVKGIIGVSENLQEAQELLELSARFPILRPCVGLHPAQRADVGYRSVSMNDMNPVIDFMENRHEKFIGIGEIGLDFTPQVIGYKKSGTIRPERRYVTSSELEEAKKAQKQVFREMLKLSRKFALPCSIHSRQAEKHVLRILREENVQSYTCVMHAFGGKFEEAQEAVSRGLVFSIPPSITRLPSFQELVEKLPLTHICLESDAPALGPVAGEVNVPRNIQISAQEIARIKQLDVSEVIAITNETAKKVFNKI